MAGHKANFGDADGLGVVRNKRYAPTELVNYHERNVSKLRRRWSILQQASCYVQMHGFHICDEGIRCGEYLVMGEFVGVFPKLAQQTLIDKDLQVSLLFHEPRNAINLDLAEKVASELRS